MESVISHSSSRSPDLIDFLSSKSTEVLHIKVSCYILTSKYSIELRDHSEILHSHPHSPPNNGSEVHSDLLVFFS